MAYDTAPKSPNSPYSKQRVSQQYQALQTERTHWLTKWETLADYIDPMAVRIVSTDRDKGERLRVNIIDNTATRALRTLQAGLQAGVSSPARPWIRLTIADDDLAAYEPVKEWLSAETRRMFAVFQRTNVYETLHMMYGSLGLLGTAASLFMESDKLFSMYTAPAGEYVVAADFLGNVNTIGRRFEKTVEQVVSEFGLANVSQTVRNLYDRGNYYSGIPVTHMVQPRRDRDPSRKDPKNRAFQSCYFEDGESSDKFLRDSGYSDFPALCPRWDRRPGDVYGTSPGMVSLGDVKQAQSLHYAKGRAIAYMVQPPVQAPASLMDAPMSMLPGGITFYDSAGPHQSIKPLWEVGLDLNALREDIYDVRQRIESAFFTDVFRMFDGIDGNMTATEVAERHEEKMLMLGPVLERLHNEMLRPLVETTFSRMIETGMTAPPPVELQGRELEVEFISVLAQAQRAIGTNAVDRYVNAIGTVAAMKPDVLDKFDSDEWAERYGDALGVDPKIIVGTERVGFIRQERARQQQREQQMAMIEQQASAAQKLGTVETGGVPNAASDILNMFSGYGSPSGVEV